MKFKRLLYSALAGNVLEFYDLGLFGFLAPLIGSHFFPTGSTATAVIASFGVYAIGFLSRPLGAIVFGYIGDKHGRRVGLSWTILTMSLPTLTIAFLPTYNQIGIASPLILVLCRFIQGMCVGGEYNGVAVFFLEHNGLKNASRYSSMLSSSGISGFLLSAVVSLILLQDFMPPWGWRIGFVIGSSIAIVGWQIRKKLAETPEYLLMAKKRRLSKIPLLEIFKQHQLPSLCTFGIGWVVGCASLTLIGLPAFLAKIIGIPSHIAYYTNTIAIVLYILFTLTAGYFGDKYKPENVMLSAAIGLTILAYPIYVLLTTANLTCVIAAQILFAFIAGGLAGPFHAVLFRLFPPTVRYTGIGFNFSLGLALFGGSAPLITSSITYYFGNAIYSSFYIAFSGLIGTLSILIIMANKLDCKYYTLNKSVC